MKVTNHIGLWVAKLTWFAFMASSTASLRIHCFKPTWPYLIIDVFAIKVRFLEPSGYCSLVNCHLLCNKYFWLLMAHFKLLKYKFPNYTTLYVHLCSFQISHGVKHCMFQCTNYHDTTNHNGYPSQLELLQSLDMCCKLTYTKILQNFSLTLVYKQKYV